MGFGPCELPILDSVTNPLPAVNVEGLTIRYGDLVAVDNLSFKAHAGRITAVLGPNGAGKTSTIECCEGLREAASGSVRVLGLDPRADHKSLVGRMGVMLQDGGVYPSARVRETVELYAALYGNVVDVDQLVATCGLGERTTSTWRQLSGDEPERIADDIVIISKGRIALSGAVSELRSGDKTLRFRSNVDIDVSALGGLIGRSVTQTSPGDYSVGGESEASVIGKLGAWLAEHGHPMTEVRTGVESLADIFLRAVGGEAE